MYKLSVDVVRLYCSTDIATAYKSHFIIGERERSNCHMIDYLSITVNAFAMRMLTSLSVDEILLPKDVNLLKRNAWRGKGFVITFPEFYHCF